MTEGVVKKTERNGNEGSVMGKKARVENRNECKPEWVGVNSLRAKL